MNAYDHLIMQAAQRVRYFTTFGRFVANLRVSSFIVLRMGDCYIFPALRLSPHSHGIS